LDTASSSCPGGKKRHSTFEDSFTGFELDDIELDEDVLKQLERIESPDKLPNGNTKCNHNCKDRRRCFVLNKEILTSTGVGICVVKKARSLMG
jgi:hypothetical protein